MNQSQNPNATIGKPTARLAAITYDTAAAGQKWCQSIDDILAGFQGLARTQGTAHDQDAVVDLFQAHTTFKSQFVLNYEQARLETNFTNAVNEIHNKLFSREAGYAQYAVHSRIMAALQAKFPQAYQGKQKIWKQLCTNVLEDQAAVVKQKLHQDANNIKPAADVKRAVVPMSARVQ